MTITISDDNPWQPFNDCQGMTKGDSNETLFKRRRQPIPAQPVLTVATLILGSHTREESNVLFLLPCMVQLLKSGDY